MKALRLASRMLGRDWRAGELRILALSVTVAVASVTAVAFFTDRIERAMQDQAAELLGADLVVLSSQPIRRELIETATRQGLQVAITVDFPSVVLVGDETVLVQVKAVDATYPLRGALKIKESVQGPPVTAEGIPASGQVWVESRLLDRLDLETGARIGLGDRAFTIASVIDYEPDREGQLFRLAPRVMMSRQDLTATGLVTQNSRVRYRLLLAGPEQAIQNYRDWWEQNKVSGEVIRGLQEGRPEIRASLDRAQRFLALAALVAVLVAGAAIVLSARQFVDRQLDVGAILRCLGAGRNFVLRVYIYRLLALGSLAGLLGCVVGYAAHKGLANLLSDWFVQQPPSPGYGPVIIGLATGLVTLAGTAVPAILRLRKVPPLRVLRRDLNGPRPSVVITVGFAVLAFGVLLMWQTSTSDLNSRMILWAGMSMTVLWLITLGLVKLIGRIFPASGAAWRYGIARLSRYPQRTVLQVTGFAVGFTALLVLALARVDLLNLWREGLREDTPNHFLINVQTDEIHALRTMFAEHGLNDPVFYPIVRGRLLLIGDRVISADDYDNPRAKRLAAREFNLTWTEELPKDNEIIAGQWWENDNEEVLAFSVEVGIANTLGIKLGDTLRYQIAGVEMSAPVSSLREVDWDSFNPNFFVIGSPGLLADAPATFITSFYLPPNKQTFISALARAFPSVTDLNVDALMRQVRTLMDRAALAIEYVFLFTILAGLLVLYAAIHTSQAERRRETALFRALGASRKQMLTGLLAEFLSIGLMAGFLAALTASFASYMIATHVFELIYRPSPWLWAWGVGGGGAAIALAGVLGTWRLLDQSPLRTLQRT